MTLYFNLKDLSHDEYEELKQELERARGEIVGLEIEWTEEYIKVSGPSLDLQELLFEELRYLDFPITVRLANGTWAEIECGNTVDEIDDDETDDWELELDDLPQF